MCHSKILKLDSETCWVGCLPYELSEEFLLPPRLLCRVVPTRFRVIGPVLSDPECFRSGELGSVEPGRCDLL